MSSKHQQHSQFPHDASIQKHDQRCYCCHNHHRQYTVLWGICSELGSNLVPEAHQYHRYHTHHPILNQI